MQAYFNSQIAILTRQIAEITNASSQAELDMDQGVNAIFSQMDLYMQDKNSAFATQSDLVQTYFDRALVDSKDIAAVFNAMNVHFLGGITLDTTAGTAAHTNGVVDLSVYDNTFDHFQYDVAHLAEYAPTYQSKTYGYPTAPAAPVVTATTTTHTAPAAPAKNTYAQPQQTGYGTTPQTGYGTPQQTGYG